jgi:5-methylcytosine-specific restriction protein A
MVKKSRNYQPRHKREPTGRKFNGRKVIDSMYDEAWVRYRAKFLKENPRCYACGEPATVTDHLRPHQGDKGLFEKTDNHIPLCKRDHDTVTAKFDMRFKAGNSIEPKIRWLSQLRAMRGLTFRVKVLPSYP